MCTVPILTGLGMGASTAAVVAPVAMGAAAGAAMEGMMPGVPNAPATEQAAAPPPSAAAAPTDVNVQVAQADERRKQMAAAGMRKTLLTSPRGVTGAAPVQRKTLLGQ
ncbi:hypothetical protein [Anaeroselena agilis]|uniref:Antifreeze protein n=1 Tax=Anaeroselena agilis TaxID=3063788 RepID=A0ABU3NZI1_9FIRM|nr:hypothetical protein [Selenomonadales bacterium 4137-cl]